MEMSLNQSVSVIVPCHNGGKWVAEAIQSALAQEEVDPQVIVVDDSSQDGSREVAASFADRVTLLAGNWGNGNHARNAGLEVATGKWVQFLDADDLLKPDKIVAQIKGASADAEMIYSPLIVRKEGEQAIETISCRSADADLIEQWLRWELCQTGAALWRTEALRRIGGWKKDLPCCQDNEVVSRAIKNGFKIEYVDQPGAVYRIWSEETVCRKDPRKVICQKTELLDECISWLKREGRMQECYHDAAAQACFEMARTWARYDLDEATNYYRERLKRGMIRCTGPAAPKMFCWIERVLGFNAAEKIAAFRR